MEGLIRVFVRVSAAVVVVIMIDTLIISTCKTQNPSQMVSPPSSA